jgi:hypothetical protein
MPETLTIAIFVFGAVLLLIGLVGGAFKLFGTEVTGKVDARARIICLILGAGFIGWGLLAEHRSDIDRREPRMVSETAEANRELTEPVQPRTATPVSAPAEPTRAVVDLSGIWQDETGSVYQISHDGRDFTFDVSNSVTGISASGRGRLQGQSWETSYRTSSFSTGTGKGTLSRDGDRLTGSFNDTQFGIYSRTISRVR